MNRIFLFTLFWSVVASAGLCDRVTYYGSSKVNKMGKIYSVNAHDPTDRYEIGTYKNIKKNSPMHFGKFEPSPDCRWLLRANQTGGGEMAIFDATGKLPQVNFGSEGVMRFTPDSKWVYVWQWGGKTFSYNLLTHEKHSLIPSTWSMMSASSDSKYLLLFKSDELEHPNASGPGELYTQTPDGKNQYLVAKGWIHFGNTFTPDGKNLIVFVDNKVYLMTPTGTDKKLIYEAPLIRSSDELQFSPDAKHIMVSIDHGEFMGYVSDIMVIALDGSFARKLHRGNSWEVIGHFLTNTSVIWGSKGNDFTISNLDGTEPKKLQGGFTDSWQRMTADRSRMILHHYVGNWTTGYWTEFVTDADGSSHVIPLNKGYWGFPRIIPRLKNSLIAMTGDIHTQGQLTEINLMDGSLRNTPLPPTLPYVAQLLETPDKSAVYFIALDNKPNNNPPTAVEEGYSVNLDTFKVTRLYRSVFD